jgi:hypothetical protein
VLFLLPLESSIFPGLIFICSSMTAARTRCFLSSFADLRCRSSARQPVGSSLLLRFPYPRSVGCEIQIFFSSASAQRPASFFLVAVFFVRVFGRRQITALGEIYSADSSCRCACVKFAVRTRDLLQCRQSKALLWFSCFFLSYCSHFSILIGVLLFAGQNSSCSN